jgi:hypothetical protein
MEMVDAISARLPVASSRCVGAYPCFTCHLVCRRKKWALSAGGVPRPPLRCMEGQRDSPTCQPRAIRPTSRVVTRICWAPGWLESRPGSGHLFAALPRTALARVEVVRSLHSLVKVISRIGAIDEGSDGPVALRQGKVQRSIALPPLDVRLAFASNERR